MAFDAVAFDRRRRTFEDAGRATCPCCGYPTIPVRGACEICPLCAWEDDGQDDPERRPAGASEVAPDAVVFGPNHDYSLSEARANFARNLTSFRPQDRDFEHERATAAIKREIVKAYERAVDGITDLERADEDAQYFLAQMYGV